jgi:hypothetical protein
MQTVSHVSVKESAASFERFAGPCALLTAAAGFLYAVAFIVISRSNPPLGGLLSALFLLLFGLLATAALTGLYERLRPGGGAFATWGYVLMLAGALGAALHGGYDLANALHPPASPNLDLPSEVDPRGLLTFGISAIGLFVLSWMISRLGDWPRGLAYVGYLSALLLALLYLGRLIVLDPTSPAIVVPALLNGFVVGPAWYLWLGIVLWRDRSA